MRRKSGNSTPALDMLPPKLSSRLMKPKRRRRKFGSTATT